MLFNYKFGELPYRTWILILFIINKNNIKALEQLTIQTTTTLQE